ncbi:MAG: hypothetical protein MHPSP_003855, partial [Paramarteilia canceri]
KNINKDQDLKFKLKDQSKTTVFKQTYLLKIEELENLRGSISVMDKNYEVIFTITNVCDDDVTSWHSTDTVASSLKRSTLKKFTSLRKSKKEINKAPVKQVESSDKPINVEDISKNDNGRDVNESKIIENQDNKFDQIQENRLDILNEEKDSKLLPNLILKTDQMSPKFSDDQKEFKTKSVIGEAIENEQHSEKINTGQFS